MTFIKATKGNPTHFAFDGGVSEVFRGGQKAILPSADGTYATTARWFILAPAGTLAEITKDQAQAARRAMHPEDAQAAPAKFPGGARKGSAAGRGPKIPARLKAAMGALAGATTAQGARINPGVTGGFGPLSANGAPPPERDGAHDLARRLLARLTGTEPPAATVDDLLEAAMRILGATLPIVLPPGVAAPVAPVPAPVWTPPALSADDTVPGVGADGYPLF
jgi:hypothetical protein